MKSQATRKPAHGPRVLPAYVYMPPADGNSFASCPIAVAAQMHAISARPTESGSACCACGTEMKIEYATAAPGAMCVIDWNRTCGSPIECSRRCSNRPPLDAASMHAPLSDSCRLPRAWPMRRTSRTVASWYLCGDMQVSHSAALRRDFPELAAGVVAADGITAEAVVDARV